MYYSGDSIFYKKRIAAPVYNLAYFKLKPSSTLQADCLEWTSYMNLCQI